MASGRFLSVSIAEDERLNSLSIEAQMMYLMAIPHLDRDGLINGNPSVLRGRACPLREDLINKMPAIIAEWVESGLVISYPTGEGTALWFKGFAKNNPLTHYAREKPSKYPPPPGCIRGEKGIVATADSSIPDTSGNSPEASGINPTHARARARAEVGRDRSRSRDEVEVEGRDEEKAHDAAAPSPPPSLLIFQEFCTKPVNQPQIRAITSAVTDLELWRRVLTEWSVRGYNMGNVKGLLDWYRDGIPPVNRNGTHGTHTKHGEADGGYDPPKLDPAIERQFAERAARKASQAS